MEENINRPVSLRATGAWAFPTQRIKEGLIPLGTFDYDEILNATKQVITILESISDTLVDQVGNDIKKNLEYLESLYSSLKLKYPNSVIDIHKEKVLTFILMKEYETSFSICEERIANWGIIR
ncbi:hypothetical protein [Paenibacillus sp. BK720]|uniref:hypothetical protein n=1 Tax=Paenibacillus sp. BK720 TaxID=2587092 RepID=UPI00141FDEF3|nr:hypothetical protein [Paenibacillus sp. BK720]NIK71956.1 hypothetical protein [Paenibacillus sp. BK720]